MNHIFCKLNNTTRLLPIPVLIATVLIACLSCQNQEEQFKSTLYKGKKYLEKENYLQAEKHLKKALQNHPQKANLHYYLGEAYLNQGEFDKALDSYNKANSINPRHTKSNLRLAKFYLQSNQGEKAISFLESILDSNPKHVQALILYGRALARKHDYSRAVEKLQKAVQLDPENSVAHILLGNFLLTLDKPKQAEKIIQRAVELDKDNPRPRYHLARLYFETGRINKCTQTLQEIVENFPDNPKHNIQLAKFYQKQGEMHLALKQIQKAIQKSPRDFELYSHLATNYLLQGKAREAEKALKKAVQKVPNRVEPVLNLARLYQLTRRFDKAENKLKQARKQFPQDIRPLKALTKLFYQNGKTGKASLYLDKILEKHQEDIFARTFKGAILLQKRKFQSALDQFDQLDQRGLITPKALYFKSLAYFGLGIENKARQNLDQVLQKNPNFIQGLILKAKILVKDRKLDKAKYLCNRALKQNINNLQAHILKGKIALESNKLDKARETFDNICSIAPQSPVGNILLGTLALKEEKQQEALEQYHIALQKDPKSYRAISMIVYIHSQNDNMDKALNFCTHRLQKYQANPKLKSFILSKKACVLSKNNQTSRAIDSCQKAIDIYKGWTHPYIMLSNIHRQKDNLERAIFHLQSAPTQNSKLVQKNMKLGMFYAGLGSTSTAQEYYRKCLKLDEEFTPAANRLTSILLSEQGKLASASSLIQRAKYINPDDPWTSATLGKYYSLKGAFYNAISQYRDALKKLPGNPTIRYNLALVHQKYGNNKKALEELKRAAKSRQYFPRLSHAKKLIAEWSEDLAEPEKNATE